jgi:hypothetical protein
VSNTGRKHDAVIIAAAVLPPRVAAQLESV